MWKWGLAVGNLSHFVLGICHARGLPFVANMVANVFVYSGLGGFV